MLQRELTREQVMQAGEQLLTTMEEAVLERGYQYFSQGVVFNTRVEQGTLLTSAVQGTRVYRVAVDLESVPNSTCSCPFSRLCKHIAATYFQAYSVFENPRTFLALAKQPRQPKFSVAMLTPAFKNLLISQTESSVPVQSPLTPASTVSDWWSFMESWTRNLSSAMETYRASAELFSSYQNVLGVAALWPQELAQLFAIHASLFHLLKLQSFVETNRQSHWFEDLAQTAERLLEQMEGAIYYLDQSRLKENHASALEGTLVVAKTLKHCQSTAPYWIFAYRLLWWNLLAEPDWVQAEVEELDGHLKDPAAHERYALLRGHFFVMEKQDASALQTWGSTRQLPLSFYLPYLKEFARNSEWQRFLDWVDSLERFIGEASVQEYRLVIAIWQEAMAQVGKADECGPLLKRFLPRSFHEYASYLYEQQQFRQWVDLQMSSRVPPSEMNSLHIRDIEETQPALLFPLYVREVNRLIGERNRSAYKEAVKLLKKVRHTYWKAGQEARWVAYIEQLSAKHSRLRAFQEELRRGNVKV